MSITKIFVLNLLYQRNVQVFILFLHDEIFLWDVIHICWFTLLMQLQA